MNGTGKTAAASGAGVTGGILLIKLFAAYDITLSTEEALAMAGLMAPVLHGAVDIVSALKAALIERIQRRRYNEQAVSPSLNNQDL